MSSVYAKYHSHREMSFDLFWDYIVCVKGSNSGQFYKYGYVKVNVWQLIFKCKTEHCGS